ncbi:MAG TPA: D-aminoacyl-tRNA deacylase [bacterium]
MRAVVQRVTLAEVRCGSETRAIGRGLVVLVAVEAGDGPADLSYMAGKVARLRIFANGSGKMDRSVVDVGGEVLLISQFTLAASLVKGRRPDFTGAERPEVAAAQVEALAEAVRGAGCPVVTGFFGEYMEVALVNDGPVTIWIDSRRRQ